MKLIHVLTCSSVLLPFAVTDSQAAKPSKRPNIIYIMADDLGIGDLGCYGQQQIKTPAVDSLAAHGMLFTNHYSGSTVSAPSRCVLMTGKHTGHSYIRGNRGKTDVSGEVYDHPLGAEEVTVAEILKRHDYTTACVGKWGLGGPNTEGHPNNQGFDYFFGYLGQGYAHRYYPDFLWENGTKIMLNNKVYSHDLIMEKALKFIDENSDHPFFLYLTPTIPHADLIVPPGELGEYDGMFDEKPFVNRSKDGKGYTSQPKPRATYAAMVSRLDKGVQMVMDLLREKGIEENTIVIFTSDNGVHSEGGHDPYYFDSNGIYRGIKRDLYDGGVHTPFIVYYPAVIKEATTADHISAFWDFLPTVCDLVGEKVPEGVDGISYLPTITGKGKQKQHDYLYFEFHERGGRRSILKDGWKLVELDVNVPETRHMELYNLSEDPSETQDFYARNPEKVAELLELMNGARTENPYWNFTPDAP